MFEIHKDKCWAINCTAVLQTVNIFGLLLYIEGSTHKYIHIEGNIKNTVYDHNIYILDFC